MRITDVLSQDGIRIASPAASQTEAITQLVALQDACGNLADAVAFEQAVLAREEEYTTALGDGIAIPHAASSAVERLGLTAITVPAGVAWNAPDGRDVRLVFLLATPTGDAGAAAEVLAALSALLADPACAQRLAQAPTSEAFAQVIADIEAQATTGGRNTLVAPGPERRSLKGLISRTRGDEEKAVRPTRPPKRSGAPVPTPRTQAQTAEPAPSANVAAKQPSVQQGDPSPEDQATDLLTDETRHVLRGHLGKGLSQAIPFIVAGGLLSAVAFLVDGPGIATAIFGSATPGAAFFKNIGDLALGMLLPVISGYIAMSIADRPGLAPGVVGGLLARDGLNFAFLGSAPNLDASLGVPSGYLGAIAAGFVAGYLMQGIKRLCELLPDSFEGIKPILLYPLLGILGTGLVVLLMSPVFSLLSNGIVSYLSGMGGANAVLLGTLVAGMMSLDLNGPFSGATYAACITMLAGTATDGNAAMASVIVAGIVPSLVVAISSTLMVKKKWTKNERRLGAINYAMGISGIVPGAIPLVATDLSRVIPSCAIGSMVAGGLSAAFGCKTMASSGGLFSLPAITNAPNFVVAIVLGSAAGALVLSYLRRPREQHMRED